MAKRLRKHEYDIFLAHTRVDKRWVARLAKALDRSRYNGRPLRPWLDQQFLDPGDLASSHELTTALERSRFLGVVLSPATLSSEWVQFEIEFFLNKRSSHDILVILRERCEIPHLLRDAEQLDFSTADAAKASRRALRKRLCPPTVDTCRSVQAAVEKAFDAVVERDEGGMAPGTTKQREHLYRQLIRADINLPGEEGLALAGFEAAAHCVLDLGATRHDASYNCKMLLAECLAAALARSPSYHRVTQRFVDLARGHRAGADLIFVVLRAYSKVAEVGSARIDCGVVLRVGKLLDLNRGLARTHSISLARLLGKLRFTSVIGQFLIKLCAEAGTASQIAAAWAIPATPELIHPVFYLSVNSRRYSRSELYTYKKTPPSRRLRGVLDQIGRGTDDEVLREWGNARREIERFFPRVDLSLVAPWIGLLEPEDIEWGDRTPFAGVLLRVNRANMRSMAREAGADRIACFEESRIVDALFVGCAGILILDQDRDTPLARRLESQSVPHAAVSHRVMDALRNGHHAVVGDRTLQVWDGTDADPLPERRRIVPERPAKLKQHRGTGKLVQGEFRKRLKLAASRLERPLRFGLVLGEDGYHEERWHSHLGIEPFRLTKGKAGTLDVMIHLSPSDLENVNRLKLDFGRNVYGEVGAMSCLIEAWEATRRRPH